MRDRYFKHTFWAEEADYASDQYSFVGYRSVTLILVQVI